jgi:hypothetical protein
MADALATEPSANALRAPSFLGGPFPRAHEPEPIEPAQQTSFVLDAPTPQLLAPIPELDAPDLKASEPKAPEPKPDGKEPAAKPAGPPPPESSILFSALDASVDALRADPNAPSPGAAPAATSLLGAVADVVSGGDKPAAVDPATLELGSGLKGKLAARRDARAPSMPSMPSAPSYPSHPGASRR